MILLRAESVTYFYTSVMVTMQGKGSFLPAKVADFNRFTLEMGGKSAAIKATVKEKSNA